MGLVPECRKSNIENSLAGGKFPVGNQFIAPEETTFGMADKRPGAAA
jgi:hypothetical protein